MSTQDKISTDGSAPTEQAQPLTPLAAFGECLAIIDTVEPRDRKTVLAALGSYKLDDLVAAGAIDWEGRARKRKIRIEELQAELDEALAELSEDDEPDDDDGESSRDSDPAGSS